MERNDFAETVKALKKLFDDLMFQDSRMMKPSSVELTRSFQWSNEEIKTQKDLPDFSRFLLERLNVAAKVTMYHEFFRRMFKGTLISIVSPKKKKHSVEIDWHRKILEFLCGC